MFPCSKSGLCCCQLNKRAVKAVMSQPTSVILPGTGEQIESGVGARELSMLWILRRDGVADLSHCCDLPVFV